MSVRLCIMIDIRLEALPRPHVTVYVRTCLCGNVWISDKPKITNSNYVQVHGIKSIVKRLNVSDSACKLHHQTDYSKCE